MMLRMADNRRTGQMPFGFRRAFAQQVALAGLLMQIFPAAGNLETFGGAGMRLQSGHVKWTLRKTANVLKKGRSANFIF